jgi:hypothetical protein
MRRLFVWILITASSALSAAPTASAPSAPPLIIDLTSSGLLGGVAGDFVTLRGTLTNTGPVPINDVTTYLSLVDTVNRAPVDLEDWSAEKGLFVGTIDPGVTLPLEWRLHFVKPGDYALTVLALEPTAARPVAAPVRYFHVAPKRTLNPGRVLPTALGTPVVLTFLLLLASYRRRRTT